MITDTLAALGLTMLLLGCAQTPKKQANVAPVPWERVSDRYSRKAVKSYELFDADIADHAMMLVQLTTGDRFPMLCRRTARGIYPIAQSVFAAPGAERWSIMCEPHADNVYKLMRLELSRIDGAFSMGDRPLKPSTDVPLLSKPSS
jgi:hypothetical protein